MTCGNCDRLSAALQDATATMKRTALEYREVLAQAEKTLQRALAAERALETLRADAWQPIETAPKDERNVMLYTRIGCVPAYWDEDGWIDIEGRAVLHPPTHWMPLPDAPSDRLRASLAERGNNE